MRFTQNQWFTQILISIIILIISLVQNTYSVINVSQSQPIVSVGNHNHITATNDTLTSYNYNLLDKNLTLNKFRRMKNRIKRSYSHERYIEVMVVADAKMANYHGDNLRQYVLTLMATVELIYRDASIGNAINIALVKLTVMDEEESKDLIYASASKTLRHFCRWQHLHNHADDSHPHHHDTSILLTREDLCRMPSTCDTLGLAQSGQICDASASCAVIEDNGLSAAFTIAHELGHVLSIPHDDDDKCIRFREEGQRHHIMARMLDYTSNPWTWSACSRHYITEFLDEGNGDCLLDKPSENLLEDMWRSDRGQESGLKLRQPGEVFDMDLQCQLVFGPTSKICPYMPVCKRLWCTISSEGGGCRTQHMPWADGTPCALNKWCQQGECIAIQKLESRPMDGQWGPWNGYSECSRSCDGGIQKSSRECNHPKPQFGGKYCTGHRIRYRSCNIHECSTTANDFREEQCRAFDGQTFNINGLSSSVKWTPHYTTISADFCKLYCNVVGTGAYYLLKQKVIDGTPCAPDSYDVCVNGKCMSAGCDHILGSQVKPDSCGVCAGDNSTCKIISGQLRRVRYGYNLVVVVPVGATNLDVRQYGSSSTDDNYLALRAHDSSYLLNGDFVVSMFHKTMQYGGITIEYSGSNEAVERINTTKPLTRQLYIEVLSVGNLSSPEVSYHYAISLERDKYEWRLNDKWSECSQVCNGEQMLTALCYVGNTTKVVDDAYCSGETKPTPIAQVCNMHCQLVWKIIKQWQCSVSCGVGTRKRLIRCTQELYNGDHHELHDHYCLHIGSKPDEYITCNGTCTGIGLNWHYSEWSDCSVTCGQGFQVRSAKCLDKDGNERKTEECDVITPRVTKQNCQMDECPHWQTGQWSACSEVCGLGDKHRKVWCKHSEQVIDDGYCDSNSKPISVEKCQVKTCSGKWHFGEWSPCEHCWSSSKRVVRCRSSTGYVLTDDECDIKEKPIEIRDCHYMSSNCNNNSVDALQSIAAQPKGQWRTGMWSQCSSSCGFGIKKRYVACLNDEVVLEDHECDLDSKPDSQLKCEVVCNEVSDELHQWRVGLWGECPITCEESVQRRLVRCYHQNGLIVDESLCDINKKPEETKICPLVKCIGEWKTSDWTQCSKSCGSDGIETRKVECIASNGSAIDDNLCVNQSKPLTEKSCNRVECPEFVTYEWRLGQWEECKSNECDDNNGTQQRMVFCVNKNDESVALHFCGTSSIPIAVRYCIPKVKCSPNPNIDLMTVQTSSLTQTASTTPSTTTTTATITAISSTSLTTLISTTQTVPLPVPSITSISTSLSTPSSSSLTTTSSTNLSTHSEPKVWTQLTTIQTPIISSTFVGTESTVNQSINSGPKWLYTEWSQCSVSCGNGTQTRQRFCNSQSVLDCNPKEKFDLEVRHCFHLCSLFQWKTFEWTECSASCGNGYKTRIIQCLDWTNSVVPNQFCDPSTKPKTIGHCKTHTCPFVWQTSEWSQCTKTCGQGLQVRRVNCHRVNNEGWVDNQPAKKKKPIKQLLSGWCNETLKPIAKRVCNFGDCERGAVWKASSWQPCSTSCGNGKQRRKVHCFSLKGKKLPKSYCEPKFRPQKRRKCNLRPCAPISCYDIHKRGNVKSDGEYDVYVRGKMIKIYCHDMQSGRPVEYLTLKTGYLENYSEIYNKRPTKADVCPYRGDKCENCVTSDARIGGGLTQFNRIRINITSLLILSNDFRFSETRDGGWQIAYGEAGDCYSVVDCPQGQFKINLKGTGLSVSAKTRWLVQGNRATKQIERLDGGQIVFGRCGGYCGRCTPSNGLYLDLAL